MGFTQTVVVNSIPLRPLKHEEKDTDRERVKRDGGRERRRGRKRERGREGATWENKQYEIMGLAVMRHSAAATLAVFI